MKLDINSILKAKKLSISCVLTAVNEGKTVKKVVDTLVSYPHFSEIILINDGSTDNTLEIFKKVSRKHRRVIVIDFQKNQGKAQGILSGIQKAKGDVVVMIDADLLTLKHSHIDKLVLPVINKEYDMTILEKGSDSYSPIGWLQFIVNRPYGGERALWKRDFIKIGLNGNERYGLETIINGYYITNKKRILGIYTPDLLALYKSQKSKNLYNSLLEWHGQLKDMYSASKVSSIRQAVEIEDQRLSKLHRIKNSSKVKSPALISIFIASLTLSIATFASLNIKRGIGNMKNSNRKQ